MREVNGTLTPALSLRKGEGEDFTGIAHQRYLHIGSYNRLNYPSHNSHNSQNTSVPASPATTGTVCFGLFRRRMTWSLSLRGWLLLLALLAGGMLIFVKGVCPFLSPTNPAGSGLLIVEGWVPDYAFSTAIAAFHTNRYECVVVPGHSIAEGYHVSSWKTYARLGAETLKRMGFPEQKIALVEPANAIRDRTYSCGLAVREWMAVHYPSVRTVDLVSLNVHTRRTRYLYQKAFGEGYSVHSIAVPDGDYDSAHWWKTSSGFRKVTGEVIAYFYARFLFHPPAPRASGESSPYKLAPKL